MTAGSDRAFGYAAKPGSAVHCIARNEAVRDWLRVSGFDRHGQTDYRSAKRTHRSACETERRTAGRLISCQNFESVADCILSQS
jgi:hypothetical protein